MVEITRWIAILVSVIGITASAAAENNLNSIPITKANDTQTKSVIDILKSYPVNKIESGMVDSTRFVYRKLPQIPFERWLGSITRNAPFEWKSDECAEYDSNVESNDKHCASFLVTVRTPQWHCPEIYLSFSVETDATVYFLNDNSGVSDFGAKGGMEQIADLEKTLAEVKAKTTPNRPSTLPAASIKAMSDNDMIMHVQALDVHSLDPSLPSKRFDQWLKRAARWPLQWWQASALEEYHSRCEPKRIVIRVTPAGIYDPEHRTPPFDIYVDIGSWEQGIEDTPKLRIFFKEAGDIGAISTPVNNLPALQNKFDEWYTALLSRKPIKPILTKTPVVQNMTKLGFFSRIRSTPGWHCYGYKLGLWKHRGRVFGTFYELDGQCADSRAPTYIVRNVNFDPKTGKLEFWLHGKPEFKFTGKLDQDMVTGKLLGSYEKEELKLKRIKDTDKSIPDSDKNVEIWCKDYAPKLRYIEEKELRELCQSLGVK